MNTMELDGYTAVIQYNPQTDEFRGEIQGLNGGADFYGKTPDELRREFRASLDFFLQTCAKHGIEPRKSVSGKFMVRVSPELHARAAAAAMACGISLNALVERALRHEVQPG
ncbi:toxin-antitoxin system HicB family antitoxin [Melaminivora suipulveris]|uniref:Toxin-antitoxin system HicB family antitoxin n=2 Tax=Melaminivora suipulveris TaxID=2109913 RepID=A0A2R3QGM8_9BURK|nr:toxin-antitoxin system HicB family antitoxin [Melaminivora suipulveris]